MDVLVILTEQIATVGVEMQVLLALHYHNNHNAQMQVLLTSLDICLEHRLQLDSV